MKLSVIEQETLNRVKQIGIQGQPKESGEQFEEDAIYKKTNSNMDFFSNEQGMATKVKGKIYKGTPFIRGNAEDKTKITELEQHLEENN